MIPGAILLRRLEPAVRAAGELPPRATDAIETLDFATLVAQAQRGTLTSGRSVDVATLAEPIAAKDLENLGVALDVLATRGSHRAIILFGDRALLADVASRRIERDLAAQDSLDQPVDVDTALRVPTTETSRPYRILAVPNPASTPLTTTEAANARPAARRSQPTRPSGPGARAPS